MNQLTKYNSSIANYFKRREEAIFVLLYGSAAEGDRFNDVDVAVFVDRRKLPTKKDLDYAILLSDELSDLLDFPIDVRVVNDAPLAFRYSVSRGEPLLVNDEEALAGFREKTWDEYFDFEPVARRYVEELV